MSRVQRLAAPLSKKKANESAGRYFKNTITWMEHTVGRNELEVLLCLGYRHGSLCKVNISPLWWLSGAGECSGRVLADTSSS